MVLLAVLAARCGNDLTGPSRAEQLKKQQPSRTGSPGSGGDGRGPFQPEPFPGETMDNRGDGDDNPPHPVERVGLCLRRASRGGSPEFPEIVSQHLVSFVKAT